MSRNKILLLGLSLIVGCFVLAGEGQKIVSGVAEYSFDDLFKLIRSKDRVYQVKSNSLSADQRTQLDRIGSHVSLSVDPHAIYSEWPLSQANFAVPEESDRKDVSVALVNGEYITIVGEVLPTTNDADGFIEAAGRIYRIEKAAIQTGERAKLEDFNTVVQITIPNSTILSSWRSSTNLSADRLPASIPDLRNQFERRDGKLDLQGLVLYSFDESVILIQSGKKIFELKRAALGLGGVGLNSGSHASLSVPESAIVSERSAE